ncbi:U3 small nucleolar RNA-associated protein 20, partial [Lecanoromycetidae sp. Uapishka_2]
MLVLGQRDDELQDIAKLCISLNAFSSKNVDEPDFDERLKAFSNINETRFKTFTAKQWRPILYNVLYYVKDEEESAISNSASYALRRFVEMNVVDPEDSKSESYQLVKCVLLPALRVGMSESSELVRTEYLRIMAHLIAHNAHWEEVNDMVVLLVTADEEASFFGNILHIQQHRRMRALRRLASEAKQGVFRSANVAHFFLPLIEHFVFNKADDESAHNLSAETVVTIGALASSLEWPQYRAMFRRFSGYISSKPDLQKTVIKLLGVAIDALSKAVDGNEKDPDAEMADQSILNSAKSTLAITMPRQEKLTDDLTNNLLPSLEKYLHDKDESTVSLRVPVAVSVVKMLKLLPTERLKDRLPPVLTDVCHILRSRAQESRDLTRKTLVEISTLIGPAYFSFILKELRSSLARGYQLHVLSYTVHSILVATSPIFKPGDLDYCLSQIMSIIMDDIFGATGQEKDAEEYISKMKEVKSSKSYDSMELVAKTATVEHFLQLIKPLQVLLEEKLDLRRVKKIDELLRRIGVGLVRNEAVHDQRVLVFCYEIIQEVYSRGATPGKKEDHRTKRLLSKQKGANNANSRKSTSLYDYKLLRFALDILRTVLQKYDALQTPSNLSGFIPIIGDAIVQSNEEVQTSALRLLTVIIKVPLEVIDDNAAVYVAECVKIVKASTTTNVEVSQAALKLVSAILRERAHIKIQDAKESHHEEGVRKTDLAYLLKRTLPDLEELDKQGVAFSFLRAVMTRKVDVPEVYEVVDSVRVIMKTNHTRGARDMARGAYIQFFMEYPQSKKLFSQQVDFLVTGLEYPHAEGRQSILETIHLLVNKIGEGLVQDILATFFFPLVMRIVNDESSQCREMAGALLKELFKRADAERTRSFLEVLRGWLGQADELLLRVALQVYGLYLEVNGLKAENEIPRLQSYVGQILKSNLKSPLDADWELLYFALQTFAKICQLFSARAFETNSASIWSSVRQCLSFPHAWVKISSAKLLGTCFADFARTNASSEGTTLPLKGSGGLLLSEQDIIEVTRSSLGLLHVHSLSEELASQSIRNLVFLGKIMAQTSMAWPQSDNQQNPEVDSGEDVESEDEAAATGTTTEKLTTKPALGHLIYQTSRILRRGPQNDRGTFTLRTQSLTPLRASLQLLAALTNA